MTKDYIQYHILVTSEESIQQAQAQFQVWLENDVLSEIQAEQAKKIEKKEPIVPFQSIIEQVKNGCKKRLDKLNEEIRTTTFPFRRKKEEAKETE